MKLIPVTSSQIDGRRRPEARLRPLVLLLRVFGVVDLLALGAVLMPRNWMAAAHAWTGLGELPDAPIVGYLTRTTSALYALHGAMILFISYDACRYWRLIAFLGIAAVVHGVVVLAIDVAAGMPPLWTWVEGPVFAATGAAVLLMQRRVGVPEP